MPCTGLPRPAMMIRGAMVAVPVEETAVMVTEAILGEELVIMRSGSGTVMALEVVAIDMEVEGTDMAMEAVGLGV